MLHTPLPPLKRGNSSRTDSNRDFSVFSSFLVALLVPVVSLAQDVKSGLNTAAEGVFGTMGKRGSFAFAVGRSIEVVLVFVGVLFFLLIVYGGVKWLFAEGKQEQIEKARTLILDATLGFIIVLAAFSISIIMTNIFIKVVQPF